MSAPDPESMSLTAKVLAGLAIVVPPIWGARSWIDKRLSKKADKEDVEKETANCLRHIEKLYENAEKDRAQTRDLHDKAMEAVRDGQQQIIQILTRR